MKNATAVNLVEEFDELDALLEDMDNEVSEPVMLKSKKELAAEKSIDIDVTEIEDDLADVETIEAEMPIKIAKAKPVKKEKVTKAKSEKTSTTVKFSSSDSLVEFGHAVLKGNQFRFDIEQKDEAAVTEECLKTLDEVKPVKVREKLANMLTWAVQGKTLSRYTSITLDMLSKVNVGDFISKADIRNNLLDAGVALSTASSQAGQMTHILTASQIVREHGSGFYVNEGSTLLGLFVNLQGKSEETAVA